ncbi:MAG: chemotaxis protein CheW [Polyangiales bacterium]
MTSLLSVDPSEADAGLALPSSPEAVLLARARRLAQPLAADKALSAGLSILCFGLGAERYAIETSHVQLTRRGADITPLPMAGSHVLGLTNVLGDLLVVFDLRTLFGLPRARSYEGLPLIVLGEEQAELAVMVDSLESVEQLEETSLFEVPSTTPDDSRSYLRGVTHTALLLLNGAALLSDARLYVDEA